MTGEIQALIVRITKDLTVGEKKIPVKYMHYEGHDDSYVTWMHMDSDRSLSGDDSLIGWVDYFDFDVYSKGNFNEIIGKLTETLIANGFVWSVSRSSPDYYEKDTGYYHKTLCFAYIHGYKIKESE